MFKGLGSLGNLGSIMKQAQQLGGKLGEITEKLQHERATGAAGGGLVEVEVNGLGQVLRVNIDPSLFEQQDRELVEDLLPAAFNQAAQRAKELHAQAMKQMTEGLNVPGLSEALESLGGGG